MISLVDYLHFNRTKKTLTKRYNDFELDKKIVEFNTSKVHWIVFLPWGVTIDNGLNKNLVPKEGKALVYQIPLGFVNKDPKIVKKLFLKVIRDCEREIKKIGKDNIIKVLSYSAANGFGYYIADKYDVDTFYSIVTGAKLGQEIWKSKLLKPIKEDSMKLGYSSYTDYDGYLGELLPYYHTSNLPDKTYIWLGRSDTHIPVEFGKEIYNKAKESKPVKLNLFPSGHIFTIFLFSLLIKFRIIK